MRRVWLVLVVGLWFAGCAGDEIRRDFVPGHQVCGRQAPGYYPARELAVTGLAANALVPGDGGLWVVESQDNTVSFHDFGTGRYRRVADVGNDRNPYDVALWQGRLWVTNYLSHTVSVVDAQTGEVVAELEHPGFRRPSGVAVLDGVAYVTSVNYLGREGFGESSVVAVDAESLEVLGEIPVAELNAQFATVVSVAGQSRVVVTSTGGIEFVGDEALAVSSGGVSVLDGLEVSASAVFEVMQPGRSGALSRPVQVPGTSYLYFASATAPEVYKLDVATMRWLRGRENPIRLYEASGDTLHHLTVDEAGMLYVTAFNTDELWRVDSRCDEVVDVIGLGHTGFLEGAHMVQAVEVAGGVDVYYLMGLSNVLGRVEFRAEP